MTHRAKLRHLLIQPLQKDSWEAWLTGCHGERGLKVLQLCIFLLKLNQQVRGAKRFLALYCVLSCLLHKQVCNQPLPQKSFEMLITKTFMLLTGVFTFVMFDGGMCLFCFVFFFCFFTLFWCRSLLVDFSATQVKDVIPIDESRLVWPSSPNHSSFRLSCSFFLTVLITKVCFCRHVSSHEDSDSIV